MEPSLTASEYEIQPYRPDLGPAVADLMQQLTGWDSARNLAYLQWKYEQNPYVSQALGTVVLHRSQVVGFRGYFALRYVLGQTGQTTVLLSPSDAIVHREHRRRGLHTAIMHWCRQEYAGQYPLFLTTSANRYSLALAYKSGHVAIGKRAVVSWSSPLGLKRHLLRKATMASNSLLPMAYGRDRGTLISQQAQPGVMAALAGASASGSCIRLLQDEAFFAWRYRNPEARYIFFYAIEPDQPQAYLVIGLAPDNHRGYILDYGDDGRGTGLGRLIRCAAQTRVFDVLSIEECYIHGALADILRRAGFSRDVLLRWFERCRIGDMPLLVRPVRAQPGPADWLLAGLDVRRPGNWALKPVVSDAV